MQLYDLATNIGSSALFLQASSHPLVPLRVVAACADSAVRVVSPISMDVLTTALLPLDREIVSVCYVVLEGELIRGVAPRSFVERGLGDIILYTVNCRGFVCLGRPRLTVPVQWQVKPRPEAGQLPVSAPPRHLHLPGSLRGSHGRGRPLSLQLILNRLVSVLFSCEKFENFTPFHSSPVILGGDF